jgi:hypothetical protein
MASDFVERMSKELSDLRYRIERLQTFVTTDAFAGLPDVERILLTEQHWAMQMYARLLKQRLELYLAKDGAPLRREVVTYARCHDEKCDINVQHARRGIGLNHSAYRPHCHPIFA